VALLPYRRHRPTSREAARGAAPEWLARGLSAAYLFGEGTGRPTDLVTGAPAAPTNAPPWVTAAEGPAVSYTAASSQLHDLGAGAWLLGTSAYTLVVRARRTASLGRISVGNGPTTSLRTGFAAYSDGNLYALAAAGGVSYGSVAHNSTAWHTYAVRFEGAGATNAARLRLFIDGTEQTLAYTGTVPAATHASPATLYAGYFTSAGQYDTGEVGAILGFRTALDPSEIELLSREPWRAAAPSRRYWPAATTTVRVTFSDAEPEPDTTRAAVIPEIAVTATPTDEGNPIDTASVTIDGEAATLEEAPDGDGTRYTVTPSRPLTPGRLHTVEWTVTTDDALDTVYSYTFTVRADVPAWVAARTVYGATADAGAIPARAVYAVPAGGFETTVPARAVYSVSQEATGLLSYVAARAVYWATDDARALLVAVSAAPADTTWSTNVGLGANVEATVKRVAAAIGAALGGSRRADLVTIGLGLEKDERATLLALGLDPAETTWAGVPLGATVRAVVARLLAEYDTVSELQQEIEGEP
jgi:methionine-rich copper-binding protein CopC